MLASAQPSVRNFAKSKSEEFATAMIEEQDYRLPKRQPKEPPKEADPATLEYLDSLPYRPIGGEW